MSEQWRVLMDRRFQTAKAKVQELVISGQLSFRSLEDALYGLTLEQRLDIKTDLRSHGLLP